ncbi:MAG: YozE family protein [Pseudomonadota bacterium]
MKFKKYLIAWKEDESPGGDFARDALDDADFPEHFRSWQGLKRYLEGKSADQKAIRAAEQVWDTYKK